MNINLSTETKVSNMEKYTLALLVNRLKRETMEELYLSAACEQGKVCQIWRNYTLALLVNRVKCVKLWRNYTLALLLNRIKRVKLWRNYTLALRLKRQILMK